MYDCCLCMYHMLAEPVEARRECDSLELGLQAAVSCLVLGPQCGSFVRAAGALKHRAISAAPCCAFYQPGPTCPWWEIHSNSVHTTAINLSGRWVDTSHMALRP